MSENVTEKTKQNNQAAEQRRKPNTGDTRRKQGAKQKQQPKTGQKAAQRPAAPKKTAQTPSRAAKPAAQKPKKPEQPAAPSGAADSLYHAGRPQRDWQEYGRFRVWGRRLYH